jgi:hypothetical protein
MSNPLTDIFNAAAKLPQTQQDIRTIAQTGEQLQSPQVQQQIAAARADLTTYAGVQLTLQMLSTAAAVLLAVLAWQNRRR